MAKPKTKIIILVVINTIFFILIGAYGVVTLISGIYFKKLISFYGLISTLRIGKNWVMVEAIMLIVFSIFYFSQVVLVAVSHYRLTEQNKRMEQENQAAGKMKNKSSARPVDPQP